MSEPTLTPAAQQLADAYARTVILVGSCGEDTHQADWEALAEDASALSVAADALSAAASAVAQDETATNADAFRETARAAIRRMLTK